MKKLVITHGNCVDGCTCRAIFEDIYKDKAEYIEVDHSDVDPAFPEKFNSFWQNASRFKNTEVFMADICLREEVINLFLENNNTVNIIDHHETALPLIQKLRERKESDKSLPLNITFSDDNSESGAMLTWKHMNPDTSPPMLVEYVSDGDLWKFKYGDQTHHTYSGLLANNRQPSQVPKDEWINLLNNQKDLDKVIELGATLYGAYIEKVKSYIPTAVEVILDGHKGYMVNAPAKYKSELGNMLAKKNGTFALVWDIKDDGMVACSLRSVEPFRVKEIAEKFGGGGHAQASAFRVESLEKFEELLSNEDQSPLYSVDKKIKKGNFK